MTNLPEKFTLFSEQRILDIGPHEFRRSIQRLIQSNGGEAFSIDGQNDHGGDIFCEIAGEIWVLQTKWKKKGTVAETAVEEMLEAKDYYQAHYGIVVSNQRLAKAAQNRLMTLAGRGLQVGYWGLSDLNKQIGKKYFSAQVNSFDKRKYQEAAKKNILSDLKKSGTSLLYLATGLGKTVVAGSVINHFFKYEGATKILVLAHMTDLIQQLQVSLWSSTDLSINTQLVDQANKPKDLSGLTISTNMSIMPLLNQGYKPDLIVIDECHHVGFENTYAAIIEKCKGTPILGDTATPWRGDGYDISATFGPPSYSCSMEEGIKQGYLSNVIYRLFCDNINWEEVPNLSKNEYTIKQLNRKLFIPQRDEQIIDELLKAFNNTPEPKCVVFCQSIEHAKNLFAEIKKISKWSNAELLHSEITMVERRKALLKFRQDGCPILLAVDILNEGVDIPTVNIVCFARVTHSRKIFVQQLGRGLRLSKNKKHVLVLDFAADIRRAAAITSLKSELEAPTLGGDIEILKDYNDSVEFNDQKAQNLLQEWLKDTASLETASDEYKLSFPAV